MGKYFNASILLVSLLLLAFSAHSVSANEGQIVLRFRYWGDFKEIAVIQQTINAYEHDHPGVAVRGERVTSGDEYQQKLLVEQAAGLTPDVIFCGGNYVAFAAKGVLQDLTPFVRADPSVHLSDYYPQVLKVFQSNGKLYALPRDVAPMGLVYYNKTLFDQAHIPYPDGSWTWDYVPHPERGNKDFLTVAKNLTRPATATSQSVFGYSAGATDWIMENFVYSTGADFVDNVFNPTRVLYNDPRVIKAMQLTADLMYKYNVTPSPVDLQSSGLGTVGTHEMFAQGRVGMYVTGIWEVPRFRSEITTFDWDIAPFPAGPTGLHGCPTGWSGYGMSTSCKHKQLAWELLKYLAGPQGLGRLAQSGLAQPALSRLSNSTLWLDGQRPKNRKLTIEEVPWIHYDVTSPKWPEVLTEIITPKIQLIWNGTLTAQQAVNQFEPLAQQKLDELNHPAPHPPLNWLGGLLGMLAITLAIGAWVYAGARKDIALGHVAASRSESRAGYAFISPWLVGGFVFLLAPILVSLLLAFASWDMIGKAQWVGLGNITDMMADDRFWKSLQVTAVYTIFAVPLGTVGSLILALLLNTKIRGQAIFRTLYYLPAVASAVAASLIWLRIFDPENGLLNFCLLHLHLNPLFQNLRLNAPGKDYVNWLGSENTALASLVVMSLWGIGGGMVIFLAGLQGVPQSYYDAAQVDGANVWQKFRHVTLPLITPTIFFTFVIGVIGSFQVFTQGFVMTAGGPNNATLFYVLYLYQNAFQFLKMGYASALAWVLFLIILCCTVIQLRLSRWVYYEGADAK